MQFATFNATCDVEIGDEAKLDSGVMTEVIDIRKVHYLKAQKIEFEFKLAIMPWLWFKRKGFVYPVVEQTNDWVLPKTTIEMCSNCMHEVEIPANEPSKCPKCQKDILPCSTCYDEIDGRKPCDWDAEYGCWRFPKTE